MSHICGSNCDFCNRIKLDGICSDTTILMWKSSHNWLRSFHEHRKQIQLESEASKSSEIFKAFISAYEHTYRYYEKYGIGDYITVQSLLKSYIRSL